MENIYLQEFITQVEHDLGELHGEKSEPSDKNRTVRGDEFEDAQQLDKLANQLDQKGKDKEAQDTRHQAQEKVASQLNELDGFPGPGS